MNSTDKIKQFFKNAELSINPDADEKVFNDVLAQQKKTEKLPPCFLAKARRGDSIWRITMKSPLIKLALAAVVIIACAIGLFFWKSTGSGIALADVLARIEQVSAYMYQVKGNMTSPGVGDKPKNEELHATALVSQEYGKKISMETLDPNNGQNSLQEIYILPQRKIMIVIMHREKMYVRMKFDDAIVEREQKESGDPRAIIKEVLKCDYKSLGRATIDGVEVEGFRTTDPKYHSGALRQFNVALGQVDVKLWVEVRTWLPIRAEEDIQMDDGTYMHTVVSDFQWDVPVDAAQFEPVIPDDYKTLAGGPIKMPVINEETAIQGLKLCADLNGIYPEKLDLVGIFSVGGRATSITPATKQLEEELKGLSKEEKARKVIDIMMPLQQLGSFYKQLLQDNKDPAYYGNIVTPQDTNQVLMRWKVSDNEYRVIFGDLHVETVTKEKLAGFEAALPK